MRIDSGLSGYYYQSRSYKLDNEAEEAPVNEAAATKQRLDFSLPVSSTLLSSSLAEALWAMDGGGRSETARIAGQGGNASGPMPAERINAHYLEHSGDPHGDTDELRFN